MSNTTSFLSKSLAPYLCWVKLEPLKLLDEHVRWRKVANILKISKKAKSRLEWIIYYYEGHSAALTARHFGISRKTFYKWFGKFDRDNLYSLHKLEDESKAPNHVRQKEITPLQEKRIIALRKQFPVTGKIKLAKKYKDKHDEVISSWKVQKVIEKHNLYHKPKKAAKIRAKRKRAQKKKKITELQNLPKYKQSANYIICLDTIVIYWNGLKRYIFTAIDKYGKVAYARMYKSKSTLNSRDFLERLYYLLDGQVPRVGHDNGTEFEKLFKAACIELGIEQYYSRVRTPKDNAVCERFNRTLKEEFIALGNFNSEPEIFNKNLTEWLIEYNFYRPHESLGYKTPVDCTDLSPMCSSDTKEAL